MASSLTARRSYATSALKIGTAHGKPGAYAYGALDALALPTGGTETFPIVIAQGRQPGPTLWLTASIHGDEYAGIRTIHDLLTPDLPERLRGAVVAVPALNPAGLRTGERTAYYHRKQDPNRLFPAPFRRPGGDPLPENAPPLEIAYRRLFDQMGATADLLIDLHNYVIGSAPFTFRDPVYYLDERDRPSAQKLFGTTDAMHRAFGFTVVNEFASPEYLKRGLHRSVSGAALNTLGIPAFTAELGGYLTVDTTIVNAATSAIRNVLRWAGMLDGAPEPLVGIPVHAPGHAVRRIQHPLAPAAGIVHFLARAGMQVQAGEVVARMRDLHGRPIGPDEGQVRTAHSGFVLGVSQGAVFFQNDPLLSMAIRDSGEMVLRYPG
ncbi:MAG: succinylglutamate desuccinylase/aspartoacylase family protein [Anaerolineae bacterium]|nr:succinylglutamate desuccinylase/aspartoacylase family protein [Anaerolineae bacterium]